MVPVGKAALPGASVPPLMMVVVAVMMLVPAPTSSAPLKVPPAFTVTFDELAIEPSTSNVPAFTVVLPV
jgi:hypothetical protein